MLETNIRIVHPGKHLYVVVRKAEVKGSHISADLLERACGRLRYQYGLAAVRYLGEKTSELFVATSRPIPTILMEDDEWQLELKDSGDDAKHLTLSEPHGDHLIPILIERALMAKLARHTNFWTLDSNRIWYEPQPCQVEDGIAAYRRYRIAGMLVDDEGIGISVDVETAFFSAHNLVHFFTPDIPRAEMESREKEFEELTQRQKGQKGTLLYDNGSSRTKCYFESAPPGVTCATTGVIRAKGRSYESLYEYYRREVPGSDIGKDAPAVQVSFRGISKPQWVAAECLRIRVMNDALPRSLSSIDKIDPNQRRKMADAFWEELGPKPFGLVAPGLRAGFWRPPHSRMHRFPIPDLVFAGGARLKGPSELSAEAYRENYKQRMEYLREAGCYYVPATVPRTLYLVYPTSIELQACERFADDLAKTIRRWAGGTGSTIHAARPIGYGSISEGIEKLRSAERDGMALFVLNEEPAAYHEVAFQLERWRIKRVTERQLRKHFRYLEKGCRNRRTRADDLALGRKRWTDFVNQNALDVLQLMDIIPFRYDIPCPYESQLFIDVGHDRRQFALSLLIARQTTRKPDFSIVTDVQHKTDHQCESINPTILADQIVRIFERVMQRRSTPLESLLILRDGRVCGEEITGIEDAVTKLVSKGKLVKEVKVDVAELHKETSNAVRLWEVNNDTGEAANPLEGIALQVNGGLIVVASTGAATLRQGTAQPFAIVSNGKCSHPVDAAFITFMASQLNWSSPRVAQRLPLHAKRVDEDLKARADQEVRRFS